MKENTYSYDEQQPFAAAEFAENPEPRCPCVLLLDTSASMEGNSIDQLNRGLQTFRDELYNDSLAMKRVEIAIVTFGPVRVIQNFTTVDDFRVPQLEASGNTPLGNALERGLDLLNQRKKVLRTNGIKLFRPWVFLMSDGEPTDNWKNMPQIVRNGEENKSFSFFALGVHDANFEVLRKISLREPMKLSGIRFREFFLWLSASLKNVSRSNRTSLTDKRNGTKPNVSLGIGLSALRLRREKWNKAQRLLADRIVRTPFEIREMEQSPTSPWG